MGNAVSNLKVSVDEMRAAERSQLLTGVTCVPDNLSSASSSPRPGHLSTAPSQSSGGLSPGRFSPLLTPATSLASSVAALRKEEEDIYKQFVRSNWFDVICAAAKAI